MFDHHILRINSLPQCHWIAVEFAGIWVGIPPCLNFYICGKAYQQSWQWSGKEMRNFSRIMDSALAATMHDPLRHHQVVFQWALTCVRQLVCWNLVVSYQTHTTKILKHFTDYLYWFRLAEDIFTTYQMSKATDSIAHEWMKDLKRPFIAEHTVYGEEWAEYGEVVSGAQMEYGKAEDANHQQEVYKSMVC